MGALSFPDGFWEWPIERRQAWHDAHPEAFSPIEDPRTPKRIGNGEPLPNLGEEQQTKPSRNTRAAHKHSSSCPSTKSPWTQRRHISSKALFRASAFAWFGDRQNAAKASLFST